MLRYPTRNHAFLPSVEWTLTGPHLTCGDGKSPPRVIALSDVRSVRLEFAPTRPELNRYRCRLTLTNGQVVEFFNRTYRGVYDFFDTSAAYVEFVNALLAALAVHSPHCRYVSGATPGNYVLGVVGFIVATGAVLLVLIFAITNGLWWLVLIKAAIIAFYLPTAWSWLRRNRIATFAPDHPPLDVLPQYISHS
jgi:hypothetical protein